MPAPWYRRRKVLWSALAALVAAGAVGLFVAWKNWWPSASESGDSPDKRWASLVKDIETPCYAHLVAKPPLRGRCLHMASKQIPPRSQDWTNAHVAVYTTAALPHAKPTLRDLTDAGQAEAIHFLEKDPDAGLKGVAVADLRDALDDSDAKVGESDPFRFDRILIANVAKGVDWEPGDRMSWARVLIQPINFKFAGYSVAATDNETQKVSSVELTDSRKVSAGFSGAIPGVEGPKISLEPSRERDVKTNSEVGTQYEKLGIDITPDFLRIIRESGKEIGPGRQYDGAFDCGDRSRQFTGNIRGTKMLPDPPAVRSTCS